jgi:hypothetical protein
MSRYLRDRQTESERERERERGWSGAAQNLGS